MGGGAHGEIRSEVLRGPVSLHGQKNDKPAGCKTLILCACLSVSECLVTAVHHPMLVGSSHCGGALVRRALEERLRARCKGGTVSFKAASVP